MKETSKLFLIMHFNCITQIILQFSRRANAESFAMRQRHNGRNENLNYLCIYLRYLIDFFMKRAADDRSLNACSKYFNKLCHRIKATSQ